MRAGCVSAIVRKGEAGIKIGGCMAWDSGAEAGWEGIVDESKDIQFDLDETW